MSEKRAFNVELRDEVAPLIRKGLQFRKPCEFKVTLRPELVEFFEEVCELPEFRCHEAILVRGILEDFYDKHKNLIPAAPSEEVSGDA